MNIKNTIKYVSKNGGITLTKRFTKARLSSGFMVSLKDYETQTKSVSVAVYTAKEYAKRINNNQFVGIWFDSESGIYCIDVSLNITNKEKAIKFGIKNKQKAIYDLMNDMEIRLS